MKRSVLILLVAGIVGLAVFLATRSNDSEALGLAPEPRDGRVETPGESEAANASTLSSDRIEVAPLDEPVRTAADESVGWRVCVVDASTNAPVAGATVSLIDSTSFWRECSERRIGFDTLEGRRVRRQLELEAQTGADGCTFFAAAPEHPTVEARSGTNWAFTVVNQTPADRCVTLRLSPDRTLAVLVVDAARNPVGGVPVALRRWSDTRRTYDSKWTDTDSQSGIATFLHFQRRIEQGPGWHAVFAFPVRDEPRIPVDASTPLDPPIALVLPETGRLRIRVRAADGSVPELGDSELRIDAFESAPGRGRLWPDGPWSNPQLDGKAEALVPWIGVGLYVTATLVRDGVEVAAKSIPGPTRAGEEVVCDLDWLVAAPHFVTGRFVLSDGRVWPATIVQAQPWIFPTPSPWPAALALRVDTHGRFRLQVDEPLRDIGSRAYRFSAPHPDGNGEVTALVALDQEIPEQGLELGDVVLDYGVLLVSGIVVDTAHRPIAGARFEVSVRTIVGQDEMWPVVSTSRTLRSGADGAFALHLPSGESLTSDQLRLTTSADGYVGERNRTVRCGDSNVEVVLAAAGALAGSLELDRGLTHGDVALFLLGGTSQLLMLNADATFEQRELLPNTYSLEVRRRGAKGQFEREPAALVEGLLVRAGETCRDPRIQALRIGSVLTTLSIRVVDRVSAPLKNAAVSIVGLADARPTLSGDGGVCLVRCEALPVDLDVAAFGYLRQRLVNVSSDRDVVLDEGFPIRLHTTAQPSGGEPKYMLGATLYSVDASGTKRLAWGSEFSAGYTSDRSHFDARGELTLRMPESGIYECAVSVTVLSENVGRGADVELSPKPRITVLASKAEQLFELSIPQNAINTALERALR